MAGLDRWYRLNPKAPRTADQAAPLNAAATSTGIGTPQMNGFAAGQNGMAEAYRQGVRNLRRASRRGNAEASLAEVQLREKAMKSGFNPSGIQDHDTNDAGIQNTADRMLTETDKMTRGSAAINGAGGPTNEALTTAAQIQYEFEPNDNSRLAYRKAIDRSLGAATSPEQVDSLRGLASGAGVTDQAFNNRARWWANKRPRRL